MKRTMAFDIDGVMRNLYRDIEKRFHIPTVEVWGGWDIGDKTIYDLVAEAPEILSHGSTTKYFKTIRKYIETTDNNVEIWSHQPKDWVEPTIHWLRMHLATVPKIRFLKPDEKWERLQKHEECVLFDDYPNFKDDHRIVMIDAPYNQKVDTWMRVKKVSELRRILEAY